MKNKTMIPVKDIHENETKCKNCDNKTFGAKPTCRDCYDEKSE